MAGFDIIEFHWNKLKTSIHLLLSPLRVFTISWVINMIITGSAQDNWGTDIGQTDICHTWLVRHLPHRRSVVRLGWVRLGVADVSWQRRSQVWQMSVWSMSCTPCHRWSWMFMILLEISHVLKHLQNNLIRTQEQDIINWIVFVSNTQWTSTWNINIMDEFNVFLLKVPCSCKRS